MVHSITYRYKWICYPLYSKHNTAVLRERRGIEYDMTGTVNVYSSSKTLYCILLRVLSQPRRLSTETVHVRGTGTEQLDNRE
jgi:hypothetical protein